MKNHLCLLLLISCLGFISCEKNSDGKYAEYLVAKPLTISKADFRAEKVDIVAPMPIEDSGKIYAYKDYLFINDKYRGVHVIDNSDPEHPTKTTFIKIAGNVDIAIKGDYLYADSLSDLVVLDISDMENIQIVKWLENVLQEGQWFDTGVVQNMIWPEADIFDYDGIDYENEVLVGWDVVTERRLIAEYEQQMGRGDLFAEVATANDNSTLGQGGSLARFKIVDNFLYAVDSHSINVFDIGDLENPKDLDDVYAGFDIETIFNSGKYLFLGSMRGMYIYDITSPATPTFVSQFEHGTACDPVVVDGNYAFVTLRGGNSCGATESGLFIIDISEISTPVLTASYPLDSPFGLGIKDEKLFICDGPSGLKVFDKTDVTQLVALNHFQDIDSFDVIPLDDSLVLIGDGVLRQYAYLDSEIRLLSTLELN